MCQSMKTKEKLCVVFIVSHNNNLIGMEIDSNNPYERLSSEVRPEFDI